MLIRVTELRYACQMTVKAKLPPSTKRTSIGSRRNPETEGAIIAAAKGLIEEKGYAGFSVDEVARRAGAGKATIYRWWPTKADLFVAIYSDEKASSVSVPHTGNLVEDLTLYTTSLWRFWRSRPAGIALRGLIAEAQGSTAAMGALRDRFLPGRTAEVRGIFSVAANRGEITANQIDDMLALWVGYSWLYLLTERLVEEDAVSRVMTQIAGLAVRDP
jgi:AcrR family transcriptional regulator